MGMTEIPTLNTAFGARVEPREPHLCFLLGLCQNAGLLLGISCLSLALKSGSVIAIMVMTVTIMVI